MVFVNIDLEVYAEVHRESWAMIPTIDILLSNSAPTLCAHAGWCEPQVGDSGQAGMGRGDLAELPPRGESLVCANMAREKVSQRPATWRISSKADKSWGPKQDCRSSQVDAC